MTTYTFEQIEQQMRKGCYVNAKKLSRVQRCCLVSNVALWNQSRALVLSEIFMSNFKSNPETGQNDWN
jgi:hypothetical protein